MPGEVVLGVDIGTSATKAVAVDAAGAVHASARRTYRLEEPAPGEAVQDPSTILAAVTDAVRETVAASRSAGRPVAGISFSSAMHSLMALDGAGSPLTPLLTWADERAAGQAQRLRSTHLGLALHRRTGTPIHPMSPLTKLIWFREAAPEVTASAARWAGIKEYVIAQLSGEWLVDHSVASGTGLMDLSTHMWDPACLDLAGVAAAQLSALVPPTHVHQGLRSGAAAAMGVPADLPLIAGAGDGPLANLGVGAVRPGVAACSIGTSGAVRVAVDAPAIDDQGRVFCYELGEGRWVVGGAINSGGVVLEWLRDTIAPTNARDDAAVLALAATAPPGCAGLLMLPYLFGERAPQWDVDARGAYVGLTHAHRTEHLLRAGLEGVCLQMALVLDSIRAAGLSVHEIRATGGFARSAFWRQLLTDLLGVEVSLPATTEGSGQGAALLGLHALGRIADLESVTDAIPIAERLAPDPATAGLYAELRPLYASLYEALTPAFVALGRRQLPGDPPAAGQARLASPPEGG